MVDRQRKVFEDARRRLPMYLPRVAAYLRRQADEGGFYREYYELKLLELFFMLERLRPRVILELGGGSTTSVFAEYAARSPGTSVVSVDESGVYMEQTRTRLDPAVRDSVRFVQCDRQEERLGGQLVCCYRDTYRRLLEGKEIDVCYVDGPSAIAADDSEGVIPCVDCIKLLQDGYRIRCLAFDSRTLSVRCLRDHPLGMQYDYVGPKFIKGESSLWWVRPVQRHSWFFLRSGALGLEPAPTLGSGPCAEMALPGAPPSSRMGVSPDEKSGQGHE